MTEVCVELNCSLDKTKKLLTSKGYVFTEKYELHDIYFTTIATKKIKKAKYKNLLDNSVLIRRIKEQHSDEKKLIYKKKLLDNKGNVIDEIKTRVDIGDIDATKQIFNNLGLFCWCDYINQNYVYKKGDIKLVIQYVKELGVFIELEEYNSIKSKDEAEKFEILTNIIHSLDLPIGNDFSCKKPFLYLKKHTSK